VIGRGVAALLCGAGESSSEARSESTPKAMLAEKTPLLERVQLPRPTGLARELVGEVIGTAILITFGVGVVASTRLQYPTDAQQGDHYSKSVYINMIWGIGVALGIMASYDLSGAQLNPAVTLYALVFGGFPARKVLPYICAQVCGAFLGAVIVTINYVVFFGSSHLGNFYCTAPLPDENWANAFVTEVIGTMLLLIAILSTSTNGKPASKPLLAAWVGLCVFAIGNAFGVLSGYALNPARDFGPRMCYLLFAAAYSQGDLWTTVMGDGYFWIPLVAPPVGAILGGAVYRMFIEHAKEPAATDEVSTLCRPTQRSSAAIADSQA